MSKRLLLVFAALGALVLSAYLVMPTLSESDRNDVRLPRDLASLRALHAVLARVQSTHWFAVLWAYVVLYITLQTLSIPGSIFLSFLAGALFGTPLGVGLVAFCSSVGASGAYLISSFALRGVIERNAPERLTQFRALVRERRNDLLWLMIGLRITPLLPNWFINAAGSHVGVPLLTFWLGTLIGVAPPSLFHVRAGCALDQLVNPSDAVDYGALASLFALGLLSIVPTLPGVREALLGRSARANDKCAQQKQA